MAVKTGNPETDRLFTKLADCGFSIGNNKILNKEFAHGDKDKGRTSLDRIIKKLEKNNRETTDHEREKQERNRRVQMYTEQVARGEEIQYEIDLTRNPKIGKLLTKISGE